MRLWIDCEWNDYKGDLISMALVDENGREWYEVLHCPSPSQWVADNVIPHLSKAPILRGDMALSLASFLKKYKRVHIVADWPEDIAQFCNLMIVGPGLRIDTPPLIFEVRRDLDSDSSEIPHQALSDARAMRDQHMGMDY